MNLPPMNTAGTEGLHPNLIENMLDCMAHSTWVLAEYQHCLLQHQLSQFRVWGSFCIMFFWKGYDALEIRVESLLFSCTGSSTRVFNFNRAYKRSNTPNLKNIKTKLTFTQTSSPFHLEFVQNNSYPKSPSYVGVWSVWVTPNSEIL